VVHGNDEVHTVIRKSSIKAHAQVVKGQPERPAPQVPILFNLARPLEENTLA
jgi:hypothetical protein